MHGVRFGVAKLIYRVVATCGALGAGFPRESLQKALAGGRIDAVIADAGSMDASPYYLAGGGQYFERDAVKNDFRKMVEAAERIAAPVILGSCGMAGGDRNLDWMLGVAKEVFEELDVRDAKVAVIRSELDPAIVIDEARAGALRPLGAGPAPDEASLRESTIVGQMGIHPLLAALHGGAKYVFAGRSCGAALFAADMLRHGIAPGLAYHVGHVLQSGALACDPGSSSDCLVAEIYDDGSAVFIAPDENRSCTPYSLAAHSLHGQAHPQLQFYPEGVLAMARTEFFAVGARSAGIRKSRFYRTGKPWPLSIKLEGARRVGLRKGTLRERDATDPPDAYEWTLYHLLQNEDVIRNRMFPVHYYSANGREWSRTGEARAAYFDVGEPAGTQNLDDRTLCAIEDVPPLAMPSGSRRLLDIARVIRSRNAGINRMTFDLLFVSKDAYEAALRSNFFCARKVADELGVELTSIVGTYFVDNCNAIKITVERPIISVSLGPGERDEFGTRQQSMLERLIIPTFADS
ncbi:hypothetical protein P3T17_005967 [Paraburkholderia sp. GAS82]